MTTKKRNITDHLANERTFLAWIRTALGLIGLGFVLARMGIFISQIATAEASLNPSATRPHAHAAHEFITSGVIFLVIGVIFGGWGGITYHVTRRAIDTETYIPAIWPVILLTIVIVAGGLLIVALVFWRTLDLAG